MSRLAVWVMAANRPDAFALLQASFERAMPGKQLCVSLDGEVAGFRFGPNTELCFHSDQKLGVEQHFFLMAAQAIAQGADWLVFLEEDLWLSPHLERDIDSLLQLADQYPQIVQWSLYSPAFHPVTGYPLQVPAKGGNGYLAAVPCSSGWLISREQLSRFLRWQQSTAQPEFPDWMQHWKDSWKKWMGAFLMQQGLYNWFPQQGWITNTGVPGQHMAEEPLHRSMIQDLGPLQLICDYSAGPRYDTWMEPAADWCLQLLEKPGLALGVDWFGIKPKKYVQGEWIISSRKAALKPVVSWGLLLRPDVLNLEAQISGSALHLMQREEWQNAAPAPEVWAHYYGYTNNWKRIAWLACKHHWQNVILKRF